jgi:integrase
MDDLFNFVKNNLRPKSLASEFISMVLIGIHKPARKRASGNSISLQSQRHHLQKMVFLMASLQGSEIAVSHLREIQRPHLSFMISVIRARATTAGSIDNWTCSLNRLIRCLRLHELQVSGKKIRDIENIRHRSRACLSSKSPSDNLKIHQCISELENIDSRVAAAVSVLAVIPLRVREILCLDLRVAAQEAREFGQISLSKGVKNGRSRIVPVWREDQIISLEKIVFLSNDQHGSLIPDSTNLATYLRYFHRTVRRVGMTRTSLMNCHALRHLGLQELFKQITGLDAPIVSNRSLNLKQNNELLTVGYEAVTRAAGHSDPTKSSAYLGSKRVAKNGLIPYLKKLDLNYTNGLKNE